MMTMLRHDAALFQKDSRQHNVLADDELALQERIQIFKVNGMPRDVLEFGLGCDGLGCDAPRGTGSGPACPRFCFAESRTFGLKVFLCPYGPIGLVDLTLIQ